MLLQRARAKCSCRPMATCASSLPTPTWTAMASLMKRSLRACANFYTQRRNSSLYFGGPLPTRAPPKHRPPLQGMAPLPLPRAAAPLAGALQRLEGLLQLQLQLEGAAQPLLQLEGRAPPLLQQVKGAPPLPQRQRHCRPLRRLHPPPPASLSRFQAPQAPLPLAQTQAPPAAPMMVAH